MTTLCKVALPDILIFFYLFIYLFIDEEEGNGLAVGYAALFFFLLLFFKRWLVDRADVIGVFLLQIPLSFKKKMT